MIKKLFVLILLSLVVNTYAQRKMENLGRGLVAVRKSNSQVFLSWRMLGTDSSDINFNLYRDGSLITSTSATNYTDTTSENSYYFVQSVSGGLARDTSETVGVQSKAYISVPLQDIGNYYVHLAWVGDLDGDGEYDFVVDRMPNVAGETPKIEAYRRDGTFLWRADMGPGSIKNSDDWDCGPSAISNGHGDNITVYDLDSDGKSEVIIISADSVKFGDGTYLTDANWLTQYISVLDGITGKELARAPVPTDYASDGALNGHFGIMYCDSANPSFVFKAKNRRADGGFNMMVVTWDYKDGALTQRWKWNAGSTNAPSFHQIRIIDVDGDGRDELCDGGYFLDDDGTFMYAVPGVVHGDRFHITDFDPDRPGLEGYCIQQDNPSGLAWVYYDAKDGTVIRQQVLGSPADLARGTAADVDPRYKGLEFWTFTDGMYTAKSEAPISSGYPWPNFKIWWDGDVLAELLNTENISKWNYTTGSESRLLSAGHYGAVDSWRDAAQFHGDIIGDWREEVLFEMWDHSEIMIFTTTIPSDTRLYTLPHNPGYRSCMTVKGYQQSNLTDYYLGDSMAVPPAPNISIVVDTSTNGIDLPPFRPQNLFAKAKNDTIDLSWNKNTDDDLAGYNIYRSVDTNINYVKLNDTLLTDNFYQDTAVIYETTYYYTVSAVDADTNESFPSNEVTVTPTLYPTPPNGLTSKDLVDTVILSWNKHEATNVTGYHVYRSMTQGESYTKINSVLVQGTTYIDMNIENGKIYYYVITCINELGLESDYSDEATAMPGEQDIYEAENADFGGGATHDSNHDGFSGTGFINFPSSGGYCEFTGISGGETGGGFTLRYRHALGNTDRTGTLTINDTTRNLTMAGTGDWTNWQITDVPITLLSGSGNVIRFASTGQDFGNLDKIILLPYKIVSVNEPLVSSLFQNYPNPFRYETVIQYNLPQSGFVTLRVIDILGHTVSEGVKYRQSAGHYEVVWNGTDGNGKSVKGGIYFYELITEDYRVVKKMIMIR